MFVCNCWIHFNWFCLKLLGCLCQNETFLHFRCFWQEVNRNRFALSQHLCYRPDYYSLRVLEARQEITTSFLYMELIPLSNMGMVIESEGLIRNTAKGNWKQTLPDVGRQFKQTGDWWLKAVFKRTHCVGVNSVRSSWSTLRRGGGEEGDWKFVFQLMKISRLKMTAISPLYCTLRKSSIVNYYFKILFGSQRSPFQTNWFMFASDLVFVLSFCQVVMRGNREKWEWKNEKATRYQWERKRRERRAWRSL